MHQAKLLISKKQASLTYFVEDKCIFKTMDACLSYVINKDGLIIKKMLLKMTSDNDHYFYGFGERYNALEQSGNVVDAFVYNQYKDQDLKTYIPMPFMMSNCGYGVLLDTKCYSKFDLSEKESHYSIEVFDSEMGIHFFDGDLKDQLKHYYSRTEAPVMVPKWTFGPWMSSNNWDNQDEVMMQLKTTTSEDIPSTVLVIEAWSDEATYYIFNDAYCHQHSQDRVLKYDDFDYPEWGRWPDPKAMVDALHENDTKLILWQIPIIKQITSLKNKIKDSDEAYAIEHDYVVKNEDGSPYRIAENWFMDSLVMDFSNVTGCQWWFDKRRYLVEELGVDGFKTDGGECIFGKELQFHDGLTGKEMRNQYPNDYIKAYYDYVSEANNGITFSRAGYTGAHSMPTHCR